MSYKLGILDQGPIFPGTNAHHARQKTVQLAQKAEEWGYFRFWVSEHHHAEDGSGERGKGFSEQYSPSSSKILVNLNLSENCGRHFS
ncbi:hypothetical protein ACIQD3_17750 [Peribacillus loiseleuriae]|uniref:hypothetical protein n=1 Tax=Peribacillus loiseleuriae TaxID=1679170 RepID=UPI00382172CA